MMDFPQSHLCKTWTTGTHLISDCRAAMEPLWRVVKDGRPPGSHGAMGPRFYLALGTFTLTENNLAAQGGDWGFHPLPNVSRPDNGPGDLWLIWLFYG